MTEALTEDGLRRLFVKMLRGAADALDSELSADAELEAPSAQRPTFNSGDRATLSVEDAAKVLGISRWSAYELCRRGELPSLRLGRRIVIPTNRLAAYIDGGPV